MDVSLQIGFALQAGLPMLRENNVQKGFFEHGDFIKVGKGVMGKMMIADCSWASWAKWRNDSR